VRRHLGPLRGRERGEEVVERRPKASGARRADREAKHPPLHTALDEVRVVRPHGGPQRLGLRGRGGLVGDRYFDARARLRPAFGGDPLAPWIGAVVVRRDTSAFARSSR